MHRAHAGCAAANTGTPCCSTPQQPRSASRIPARQASSPARTLVGGHYGGGWAHGGAAHDAVVLPGVVDEGGEAQQRAVAVPADAVFALRTDQAARVRRLVDLYGVPGQLGDLQQVGVRAHVGAGLHVGTPPGANGWLPPTDAAEEVRHPCMQTAATSACRVHPCHRRVTRAADPAASHGLRSLAPVPPHTSRAVATGCTAPSCTTNLWLKVALGHDNSCADRYYQQAGCRSHFCGLKLSAQQLAQRSLRPIASCNFCPSSQAWAASLTGWPHEILQQEN